MKRVIMTAFTPPFPPTSRVSGPSTHSRLTRSFRTRIVVFYAVFPSLLRTFCHFLARMSTSRRTDVGFYPGPLFRLLRRFSARFCDFIPAFSQTRLQTARNLTFLTFLHFCAIKGLRVSPIRSPTGRPKARRRPTGRRAACLSVTRREGTTDCCALAAGRTARVPAGSV